jgi:type I restriction enzyme S subunit
MMTYLSNMKKYDSYKDSGIEWIGEIPSHWEVKRLKRLAKICNGQDHKNVWDINGDYPIIGTGGVFGNANNYLHKGPSVILGRKGTIDKPQFIDFPFWSVDTAYYTDIYSNTNPKYFYYLCTTINFDLHKYGSAVPSMTQEVLSQILFVIPNDINEQTAIATYLDRKTSEIDNLIANKKRLLELYEEEKTAIINQAVTKGIDANVKMKNSGIEWLGEVPEHWEVKKLKYVAKINPTKNTTWKNSNKEVVFLPMEKVSETGDIDCEIKKTISELWNGFTYFEKNDVIVAKITPCFENGKAAFLNHLETEIGFGSTEFHVLRANEEIFSNYLFYITRSELFMKIGEAFMTGAAGQKRVPTSFISEFYFSIPPLDKQQSIVHHIETECNRIDAKIAKTKKLIDLLTEYRTALISEVVTGKIKVVNL